MASTLFFGESALSIGISESDVLVTQDRAASDPYGRVTCALLIRMVYGTVSASLGRLKSTGGEYEPRQATFWRTSYRTLACSISCRRHVSLVLQAILTERRIRDISPVAGSRSFPPATLKSGH